MKDFDGDQMAAMLMLDNRMSEATEGLAPHKSVIDSNKPRALTNLASMPKPVGATINNWLMGKDRKPINKIK